MCSVQGGLGFSQSPSLVRLDQQGITGLMGCSLLNSAGIGHQKVITDDLNRTSQSRNYCFPVIIFSERIFQGDDRVVFEPVLQELQHLYTIQHTLISAETIAA